MTATLMRFLAILVLAPAALAQVEAGRILGTVLDPHGAAVPNAAVTVTDVNTNRVYPPLTTNNSGDFVLTPVDPGNYRVEIKASGFSVAVFQNVEVVVGQSARVDAKLTIGEVTTQIEVAAVAPLLSTESGTLGQEINNKEIVDLPLNSRSFYQLASLTPGSTALPATGNVIPIRANNENGTGISGVKGQMTSFYMDGADITDHHQGGTLIQVSIDAIQEFQVQQSEYTAEFRNAGGVINATTKSGTSQVHFGGFDFFTNDKLDARAFFALSRPSTKRNQFGGWIGGPLPLPKVPSTPRSSSWITRAGGSASGKCSTASCPALNEKNGIFTG